MQAPEGRNRIDPAQTQTLSSRRTAPVRTMARLESLITRHSPLPKSIASETKSKAHATP